MAKLLDDGYLSPYVSIIKARSRRAFARAEELTQGKSSLADWASAHE